MEQTTRLHGTFARHVIVSWHGVEKIHAREGHNQRIGDTDNINTSHRFS